MNSARQSTPSLRRQWSPMNWASIRAEFPALENWTWLNTATFGQVPLAHSRRRRCGTSRRRDETACADFLTWFDDVDEIRALIAQLIHCEAGRHRVRHECGVGALAVSRRHGLARGRSYRHVARRVSQSVLLRGVAGGPRRGTDRDGRNQLAAGPHARGAGEHGELLERLSPRCGAHLAARARRAGALLYVDGTQSVGALRVRCAPR